MGTCGILEIPIITLSESVNVIWKRLCVSVFDSSPTQVAMLTLDEEDRSPLLWEKAYGKAALQHSVVLCLCLLVIHVKLLLKDLLYGHRCIFR